MVKKEHSEIISKIMKEVDCSRKFECYRSNFKKSRKAEDKEMEGLVSCFFETAENGTSKSCRDSVFSDGVKYCSCPLNVYVTKNLRE